MVDDVRAFPSVDAYQFYDGDDFPEGTPAAPFQADRYQFEAFPFDKFSMVLNTSRNYYLKSLITRGTCDG
jgi:hypothetical protein